MRLIRRSDKTLAERQLLDRDGERERAEDAIYRARHAELFPVWRCPGDDCHGSKLLRDGDRLTCRWCRRSWATTELDPEREASTVETAEDKDRRRRRIRARFRSGVVRD